MTAAWTSGFMLWLPGSPPHEPPQTALPALGRVLGKAARQGKPRAFEQAGFGREPGIPAGETGKERIERGLARRPDVQFARRAQRLGRRRRPRRAAVSADPPD